MSKSSVIGFKNKRYVISHLTPEEIENERKTSDKLSGGNVKNNIQHYIDWSELTEIKQCSDDELKNFVRNRLRKQNRTEQNVERNYNLIVEKLDKKINVFF